MPTVHANHFRTTSMNAAAQLTFEDLYRSASEAHQAGDLPLAEKLYRKSLARKPESADVVNGLCFALMQQGQLGEAETLAKRATKQHPKHGGLWNLLGHIHSERGHSTEAMAAFRSAIEVDPKLGLAWANLGNFELAAGNMAAAIAVLKRAVKILPTNTEALNNLALAYIGEGDLDQAEIALQQSMTANAKRADTYGYLGQIYRQRGDTQKAVSLLETSIALGTSTWSAFGYLGDCYRDLDQYELALQNYEKALALNPDHQRLRFIRAEILVNLGHFQQALHHLSETDPNNDPDLRIDLSITKAQALQAVGDLLQAERLLIQTFMETTDHERAASALANFYDREGTPERAIPFLEANVRSYPQSAEVHYNMGTCLAKVNQTEKAIQHLQEATKLRPTYIMAHQNMGMAYLRTLRMTQGWTEYAWRSSRYKLAGSRVGWRPSVELLPQDMHGQSVEIVGEQGIGDELFFMRYLPALKSRGAHVTYRALARKLRPLLETGDFIDQIADKPGQAPANAIKIFAGDLPLALGQPDIESFPGAVALKPSPDKVQSIQEKWLAPLGDRPKIGLAWRAGTLQNKLTRNVDILLLKEVPLEPLLDLLATLDVDVVVLQRKPTGQEMELIAAKLPNPFLDASDMDEDLSDTLAMLAGLDGLVGVSNTNVHLYAGIGGSGDILAPYPQDFRWPEACERSPWFPSFDLHRQSFEEGWGAAFTTLAASLNRKYSRK